MKAAVTGGVYGSVEQPGGPGNGSGGQWGGKGAGESTGIRLQE